MEKSNQWTFKMYQYTSELPSEWDALGQHNIFLSKKYLKVLEQSAPDNMKCHFFGFFQNNLLVGIALAQYVDLNQLKSFGDRDQCLKKSIRNFIFKHFSSHVLFMGNNMLTGQHAFYFSATIPLSEGLYWLRQASEMLIKNYLKKGVAIHLTSFKDFDKETIEQFDTTLYKDYFVFSTQPNMVFEIPVQWQSIEDYTALLSKKYRDQYKRARKKATGITKLQLDFEAIKAHEPAIHNLYEHVAQNAPFNTFFLAPNHFSNLKQNLGDCFLFYGYFLDGHLIGFNTLIQNNQHIDTYFLGYNQHIQKDKMLYLNMLYDMLGYSIKHQFQKVIFSRTALEIKSAVGAKPVTVFGLIKHENKWINYLMPRLFDFLEPKTIWNERNPFKESL